MGHGPCLFRESDVRRAIKAARSAGIEIGRIEIAKGVIVVVPGKPDGTNNDPSRDDLDQWIAGHAYTNHGH